MIIKNMTCFVLIWVSSVTYNIQYSGLQTPLGAPSATSTYGQDAIGSAARTGRQAGAQPYAAAEHARQSKSAFFHAGQGALYAQKSR